MATRLDQQIEQLEDIVEKRLGLCKVTWNDVRCTLPANHEPTEPHHFPTDSSPDAKPAGGTQRLSRPATRSGFEMEVVSHEEGVGFS